MKFPLPLILLLTFLVSCTSPEERAIEATLTFAGANRAELEKVLHHYQDEPLKQEAARFLINHMKDRHFYRSAGTDSIRHYLTVAARQESCLPFLFWLSLIMAVAGCAFSVLPSQIGGWKIFAVFVLLAVMVAGWQMYGHYRHRKEAEEKWERCRILYRSGAYEQAVESYAEHYMKMKHHAHFLFEYGHALHKLHRNEESNAILEEALKVSSDPMILNIVGNNHQEMGNYKEAEHWLILRLYEYK